MPRTKEKLALDSARRMLHHRAYGRVANLLAPLHPAEVAEFLSRVPLDDRRRLVAVIPPARLPAVFSEMAAPAVADTIADLEAAQQALLLSDVTPAHAAAILRSLPSEGREAVLTAMGEGRARTMGELLAWPEGSVGAIMRPAPFALPEDLTVEQAADHLRRAGEDAPLTIYVVDGRRHLVGVLSFRQILIAGP